MQIDVTPEPSPAEREAVIEAIQRLLGPERRAPASAWWREGVRENVYADEAEPAEP